MPESVHSQENDQSMADAPQDQDQDLAGEDVLEMEDKRVIVVRLV